MSITTPSPAPELRARFDAVGGKPTYVRGMFGNIARVYDLMNLVMTGGMDRRWRAFAARQIALGPGQRGLDIGTGTGDLAIALARASAPDATVIGVDFTPEMLELARQKLPRAHLEGHIAFQLGDGEHLDFTDATFDACCSAFVVRNLDNLGNGFSEMLRVVKPGGRVVCLEMTHPRSRLFAAAFRIYFDKIVPLLGKLVGRSFEAYSYLPTSVTTFPDAPHLKAVMEAAGWGNVRYYYRGGGTVAIHVATKPA